MRASAPRSSGKIAIAIIAIMIIANVIIAIVIIAIVIIAIAIIAIMQSTPLWCSENYYESLSSQLSSAPEEYGQSAYSESRRSRIQVKRFGTPFKMMISWG